MTGRRCLSLLRCLNSKSFSQAAGGSVSHLSTVWRSSQDADRSHDWNIKTLSWWLRVAARHSSSSSGSSRTVSQLRIADLLEGGGTVSSARIDATDDFQNIARLKRILTPDTSDASSTTETGQQRQQPLDVGARPAGGTQHQQAGARPASGTQRAGARSATGTQRAGARSASLRQRPDGASVHKVPSSSWPPPPQQRQQRAPGSVTSTSEIQPENRTRPPIAYLSRIVAVNLRRAKQYRGDRHVLREEAAANAALLEAQLLRLPHADGLSCSAQELVAALGALRLTNTDSPSASTIQTLTRHLMQQLPGDGEQAAMLSSRTSGHSGGQQQASQQPPRDVAFGQGAPIPSTHNEAPSPSRGTPRTATAAPPAVSILASASARDAAGLLFQLSLGAGGGSGGSSAAAAGVDGAGRLWTFLVERTMADIKSVSVGNLSQLAMAMSRLRVGSSDTWARLGDELAGSGRLHRLSVNHLIDAAAAFAMAGHAHQGFFAEVSRDLVAANRSMHLHAPLQLSVLIGSYAQLGMGILRPLGADPPASRTEPSASVTAGVPLRSPKPPPAAIGDGDGGTTVQPSAQRLAPGLGSHDSAEPSTPATSTATPAATTSLMQDGDRGTTTAASVGDVKRRDDSNAAADHLALFNNVASAFLGRFANKFGNVWDEAAASLAGRRRDTQASTQPQSLVRGWSADVPWSKPAAAAVDAFGTIQSAGEATVKGTADGTGGTGGTLGDMGGTSQAEVWLSPAMRVSGRELANIAAALGSLGVVRPRVYAVALQLAALQGGSAVAMSSQALLKLLRMVAQFHDDCHPPSGSAAPRVDALPLDVRQAPVKDLVQRFVVHACRHLQKDMANLKLQELGLLATCCATLRHHDAALLEALASHIDQRLWSAGRTPITPNEAASLVTLLQAFQTLGKSSPALVEAVAEALLVPSPTVANDSGTTANAALADGATADAAAADAATAHATVLGITAELLPKDVRPKAAVHTGVSSGSAGGLVFATLSPTRLATLAESCAEAGHHNAALFAAVGDKLSVQITRMAAVQHFLTDSVQRQLSLARTLFSSNAAAPVVAAAGGSSKEAQVATATTTVGLSDVVPSDVAKAAAALAHAGCHHDAFAGSATAHALAFGVSASNGTAPSRAFSGEHYYSVGQLAQLLPALAQLPSGGASSLAAQLAATREAVQTVPGPGSSGDTGGSRGSSLSSGVSLSHGEGAPQPLSAADGGVGAGDGGQSFPLGVAASAVEHVSAAAAAGGAVESDPAVAGHGGVSGEGSSSSSGVVELVAENASAQTAGGRDGGHHQLSDFRAPLVTLLRRLVKQLERLVKHHSPMAVGVASTPTDVNTIVGGIAASGWAQLSALAVGGGPQAAGAISTGGATRDRRRPVKRRSIWPSDLSPSDLVAVVQLADVTMSDGALAERCFSAMTSLLFECGDHLPFDKHVAALRAIASHKDSRHPQLADQAARRWAQPTQVAELALEPWLQLLHVLARLGHASPATYEAFGRRGVDLVRVDVKAAQLLEVAEAYAAAQQYHAPLFATLSRYTVLHHGQLSGEQVVRWLECIARVGHADMRLFRALAMALHERLDEVPTPRLLAALAATLQSATHHTVLYRAIIGRFLKELDPPSFAHSIGAAPGSTSGTDDSLMLYLPDVVSAFGFCPNPDPHDTQRLCDVVLQAVQRDVVQREVHSTTASDQNDVTTSSAATAPGSEQTLSTVVLAKMFWVLGRAAAGTLAPTPPAFHSDGLPFQAGQASASRRSWDACAAVVGERLAAGWEELDEHARFRIAEVWGCCGVPHQPLATVLQRDMEASLTGAASPTGPVAVRASAAYLAAATWAVARCAEARGATAVGVVPPPAGHKVLGAVPSERNTPRDQAATATTSSSAGPTTSPRGAAGTDVSGDAFGLVLRSAGDLVRTRLAELSAADCVHIAAALAAAIPHASRQALSSGSDDGVAAALSLHDHLTLSMLAVRASSLLQGTSDEGVLQALAEPLHKLGKWEPQCAAAARAAAGRAPLLRAGRAEYRKTSQLPKLRF